ncbi:hypothetical protein J6590_064280 [Homalodisca vitripennis]|nr:hypothetical protein J6590_064280 [Homalodisca vitripennis]
MDQFHTLSIQQKSMECRGLYIHFSQLVQEIQNVSIDEDLKMDWKKIDEIHDDSSLLVKGIQNVSIAEDLKMDWKKIDEIHDDSSQLVQDIQNVSIDEDLKMDWKRIDEIHVDSSLLVQAIQNVSIAEDLKMDWKRIDEIHDDSSLLIQGIQNVSIAEDLKKESTKNNKFSTFNLISSPVCERWPYFFPRTALHFTATLVELFPGPEARLCSVCALGVEELAAIPCVSSESDSVGVHKPPFCVAQYGSFLCLSFHIHVRHGPYSEHILTYRIKLPPIYRDMAESTDDKFPRRYALTLHIIFLRLRGTEQGKVLCRVKRTVTWKRFDSHNVFDERNETRRSRIQTGIGELTIGRKQVLLSGRLSLPSVVPFIRVGLILTTLDQFHTLNIQQKSMECRGLYIHFSQLVQEIQNVSIDEDLKMDWNRIDEIHDDSSLLVKGIQNVSIAEDLKMDWKKIDEIHDDSSQLLQDIQNVSIDEDLKMDWKRIDEIHVDSSLLVQGIQNVSIAEDLKMDWKRIDEIHDDSSLLVQGIQNVSIAEDLKMNWKRIDEMHNDSSPLVQKIQDLCIADDLKKESTENNKNRTSFHCHRSRAIRAGLGCVLCALGVERLAAIPCVSLKSDSGQTVKIPSVRYGCSLQRQVRPSTRDSREKCQIHFYPASIS